MTRNELLMQMQADLLGCEVRRMYLGESTGLGAAIAAAMAPGVDLWDWETVRAWSTDIDRFRPTIGEEVLHC